MEMLFANMVPGQDSRQPKIAVAISDVHAELTRYKNDRCSLNDDILLWWKDNEMRFPYLFKFAKQRLSASATSVPSERLFSSARTLISARRSCLSSENVDMLLFLNKNIKMFGF